jgi:hypothetical protein
MAEMPVYITSNKKKKLAKSFHPLHAQVKQPPSRTKLPNYNEGTSED